jgi:COP9 signalosome complex subunit 3
MYHYTGGMALAMLKKWKEAEELFEIAVTAPGTYPAALQLEALKKLRLVQLISRGKISPLPKYTHPLLIRQFKSTPYQGFVNSYPHSVDALRDLLHKERNIFSQEKNTGLMRLALDRAPRWALKKLTATYLSLNLADIAKEVKIEREEDVRAVLLSMVRIVSLIS